MTKSGHFYSDIILKNESGYYKITVSNSHQKRRDINVIKCLFSEKNYLSKRILNRLWIIYNIDSRVETPPRENHELFFIIALMLLLLLWVTLKIKKQKSKLLPVSHFVSVSSLFVGNKRCVSVCVSECKWVCVYAKKLHRKKLIWTLRTQKKDFFFSIKIKETNFWHLTRLWTCLWTLFLFRLLTATTKENKLNKMQDSNLLTFTFFPLVFNFRQWQSFWLICLILMKLNFDFFKYLRGRFHQRFTRGFYSCRSLNCKKTLKIWLFFALLGSAHAKAARKHVGEIDPWVKNTLRRQRYKNKFVFSL